MVFLIGILMTFLFGVSIWIFGRSILIFGGCLYYKSNINKIRERFKEFDKNRGIEPLEYSKSMIDESINYLLVTQSAKLIVGIMCLWSAIRLMNLL